MDMNLVHVVTAVILLMIFVIRMNPWILNRAILHWITLYHASPVPSQVGILLFLKVFLDHTQAPGAPNQLSNFAQNHKVKWAFRSIAPTSNKNICDSG